MARQVFSGYELLEIVGEGPHGIVYRARDSRSHALVAVKIFHEAGAGDARKLLSLRHPHVASLRDAGHSDARPFRVTEYLPGGTLKDHIRSLQAVGEVFSLDQILSHGRQVGEALAYMHAEGVAHGNLKSENVMLGEGGIARLTDFMVDGGLDFEASRAADIKAFGCLLYELATTRLPFPGAEAQSIDRLREVFPDAFVNIVDRCLDRGRHNRYEDFPSIVAALNSAASPATVTRLAHPGSDAPPALAAGRTLAGRFKIVRFIARGGMGEVYEAEDLDLKERVALKTVRPEIAGAAPSMERFKREIQLARKVTHPNVCRVFDLFYDGSGAEKITFLTMELLQGETLHHKIQRSGKMSPGEALPIVVQMAAGLAAAHRAGVIHRDFKSSNVILVSADEGAYRAVVTDFGLARSTLNLEFAATLSNRAEALGTPAYMAPEQLEGGNVTAAADIYTFGTVIYEMVAGTLPFAGEFGLAAVLKRLQSPPPSPRERVPDLSEAWERSILRCLERKPEDRFESLDAVVRSLRGEPILESPVLQPRPAASVRGRRVLFAAGAAVLLAMLILGGRAIRDRYTQTQEVRSRPAIAVLGFRNLTGDADSAWLSTALAEMLTTELAAGEKLRAIPGENVARMKAELSLPDAGSFASDTLSRIRNYLGADVVIYGSYVVLNEGPGKIRIDLRLQDSVRGTYLANLSQEGYSADLLQLVSRTGAELRDKLGIDRLQPTEAEVAQAALPATAAAARFYAEGLDKLRVFDAQGARTALEKAVEEDGRHALARAALATAWAMSGHVAKAREQSQIALGLSAKLSREDQLLVEGRSREAALEWGKAAEVFRTLFGFFPDNLDYGLRLAGAQTSAGQVNDALATIERLRQFPAPNGSSPRIDLAEARAAGEISNFKRQLEMASLAVEKGTAGGARLLAAGAKLIEGSAFVNLGEWKQAQAAFEDARRMYTAAGNRWDSANASTNLAYVQSLMGNLDEAETVYQQSLATYREIGDQKGTAAALTSIANVCSSRGDLMRAKSLHEEALKIYREIGDRVGEAKARNNLANVLSRVGDQRAARGMWESALAVFREIGNRDAVATVLSNLGALVSDEGDFARARELYEESRDTFRDLGNRSSLAHALSLLGDLQLIDGDLVSARQRYEEALSLRQQLGASASAGESHLALAQVSLHEGDAAAAEAAAKKASDEFRKAGRSDDEASAMAVLARSLLVQKKQVESDGAIKRAEELALNSNDNSVRLSVAITAASILASRGETAKPLKDLAAVVDEARRAKLVRLELEARLALAEVEIVAGRGQSARQRLEALEIEASRRGYRYIAERAAARRKIGSRAA